ncbi:MAG: histidine phosphatase family protein [Clostridia bacterium]|nr:histidine phosphatase family protein [Clostridia bacterium]
MTTLLLIRHGQSNSNLEKIFTGQTETVLTPLGHAQAEAVAARLAEYPIDHIYSSDLVRVLQTAAPTAERFGKPVIPSKELREIFAGEWEGRSYEYLREHYPDSYRAWREDIGRAHPDGGESTAELSSRVYAEVDRIASLHQGQCVAIFTHATPLRMLGARWHGLAPERAAEVPWCPNASLTVVEIDGDGKTNLILYGDDSHQGDLASRFPTGAV